jgi:hypothetical protein
VYFLQTKDEAFNFYLIYEAWLSNQYNARIKCLNSDRGGEYLSKEFSDHLKKAGTTRRLTVHDTPEHNGVAERGNRTNLEIVRAMLHDSGLPKFLWAEAVSHAIHLRNRIWTRAIGNSTPYELFTGSKPDLGGVQPWGCKVRVHDTGGSKLDARSRVGRWVGFDPDTKDGNRIYWPEKRSITVERSVKFNFSEEVVMRLSPVVEGENSSMNSSGNQTDSAEAPIVEGDRDLDIIDEPVVDGDGNLDIVESPDPAQGRGKRIRKETKYVRMLKEGSAITGQRSLLPKGMRKVQMWRILLSVWQRSMQWLQ